MGGITFVSPLIFTWIIVDSDLDLTFRGHKNQTWILVRATYEYSGAFIHDFWRDFEERQYLWESN
jgi:hypothetical protein